MDRDRVSDYFYNAFEAGESYASISSARKAIALEIGQKIEPGTAEAKTVDEAIELALVKFSRNIVDSSNSIQSFDLLVDLYNRQPTLGVRSSTSARQQAYSTVLPLAYLASELAGISKNSRVYEPTAGNGALLIGADPANTTANELNPDRAQQLRSQGFTVTEYDATEYLPEEQHDVVIANPPFGRVKGKRFSLPGNPRGTSQIDQAIAMQSLQAMKDDGKAVLIMGGKPETDPTARADAYNTLETRGFFYVLHQQYKVVDHFTVNGDLYRKQGAGWPIDVIVIDGRGKSDRPLPAVEPPRIYNSFNELRGYLDEHLRQNIEPERLRENGQGLDPRERRSSPLSRSSPNDLGGNDVYPISRNDKNPIRMDDYPLGRTESQFRRVESQVGSDASGNLEPTQSEPRSSRQNRLGGRRETAMGLGNELGREPPGIRLNLDGVVRDNKSRDRFPDRSADLPNASLSTAATQRDNDRAILGRATNPNPVDTLEQNMAESFNTPYRPRSRGTSPGTLIPTNMEASAQKALDEFEQEHGDIDRFIQNRLGYDSISEMYQKLYAEQIDSLALAFAQKDKGYGFLNGDQTGNGKGRFGAANIIDAKRQGYTPVFVTQKPNLYASMLEDLSDIGFAGTKPFLTNTNESITKTDGSVIRTGNPKSQEDEMYRISQTDDLGGYDVIFTTYNQLQTVGGKEPYRRDFMRAIAPNAVFIFDEAHEAGGGQSSSWKSGPPNRAEFVRELIDLSAGTIYMSATATKNPAVMDLYARRTEAKHAVQSLGQLEETLKTGGIPLQQMMATQFVGAGNMLRRERSFDNISFEGKTVEVNQVLADRISGVMRAIAQFDEEKQKAINILKEDARAEAKELSQDNSIGKAGVDSTNFTSLMHNAIDQGLLTQKAEATVQEALATLNRGEKPVIAVSSTMDAFIKNYADTHGIKPGDEINITYGDLLQRYLERSREITVKDFSGNSERQTLTDDELGVEAMEAYEEAAEIIANTDFSSIPLSSIDYMKFRLQQEGYRVDEITGRKNIINYTEEGLQYATRSSRSTNAQAKIDVTSRFNSGQLDVVILNRSGATGINLHASEKFSDQRPRHMIMAQAERDINQVMQMLGRVNRFGQTVEPSFTLLMADVPAEKRLGAILAKKMASLNANTTAGRDSSLSVGNIVDIINVAGEEVITELLEEHSDLEAKLAYPSRGTLEGETALIQRVTGRIPLLSISEQENLYSIIEAETLSLVEQKEAMGANVLRADQLDLDAITTSIMEVEPADSELRSEFTGPVMLEVVDAKAINKPPTQLKLVNTIRENLGLSTLETLDSHDPRVLVDAGIGKGNRAIFDLEPKFEEFKQKLASRSKKAETLQKQYEVLDNQLEAFTNILHRFPPGASVEIAIPDGKVTRVTYGVVADFGMKSRAMGSPSAPSNWSMQVLTHTGKHIPIPFSKINSGKSSAIMLTATDTTLNNKDIYQEFDRLQETQRVEMQVFTGNLLKAFEKFPGGKFVNFTDHQGQTRQGLLMDSEFDIVAKLQELPVEVHSPEQVKLFIEELSGSRGIIESVIDDLKIQADTPSRLSQEKPEYYTVTVPSSAKKGGRYFKNEALTNAADSEFFSIGSRMEMKVAPEDLDEVAKVLMNQLETKLAVLDPSYKEILRHHLGENVPVLKPIEPELKKISVSVVAPAPTQRNEQASINLAPPKPSVPKPSILTAQSPDSATASIDVNVGNSSVEEPQASKTITSRTDELVPNIKEEATQISLQFNDSPSQAIAHPLENTQNESSALPHRSQPQQPEAIASNSNPEGQPLEPELSDPIASLSSQNIEDKQSPVEVTPAQAIANPLIPEPPIARRILPPSQQGSEAAKNIAQLLHESGLDMEVLTEAKFHVRATQESFLPLVVEQHSDQLFLTHYNRMNGDSFIDAEMVFSIGDRGNLSLQETASFNPLTGGELRNKDHSFAKLFSSNLLGQGWAEAISKTREEMKQSENNTSPSVESQNVEIESGQVSNTDTPKPTNEPIIAETKTPNTSQRVTQIDTTNKNIPMVPQNWAQVAQAIGHAKEYVAKVIDVQDKPLTNQAKASMKRDFETHGEKLNHLRNWYHSAQLIKKPNAYLEGIQAIANDFKEGRPIPQTIQSTINQDLYEGVYTELSKGIENPNGEKFLQQVAQRGLERKMSPETVSAILINGNTGLRDTHQIQPNETEKFVKQVMAKAIQQLPEAQKQKYVQAQINTKSINQDNRHRNGGIRH